MKKLYLFGFIALALMVAAFVYFSSEVDVTGGFYGTAARTITALAATTGMMLSSFLVTLFIMGAIRIKSRLGRITSISGGAFALVFFGMNTIAAIDYSMGMFRDMKLLWVITIMFSALSIGIGSREFKKNGQPELSSKGEVLYTLGILFTILMAFSFGYALIQYYLTETNSDLIVMIGFIGLLFSAIHLTLLSVGIFRIKSNLNRVLSIIASVLSMGFVIFNIMAATNPYKGNFDISQYVWLIMSAALLVAYIIGKKEAKKENPNYKLPPPDVLDHPETSYRK